MRACLYVAWNNLVKKGWQNSLIFLVIMASVLLLATSITLFINTNSVYQAAMAEAKSSDLVFYSLSQYQDKDDLRDFWADQAVIWQVDDYLTYDGTIHAPGQELNSAIVILPYTGRNQAQNVYQTLADTPHQPQAGEIWLPSGFVFANDLAIGQSLGFSVAGEDKTFRLSNVFIDPLYSVPIEGATIAYVAEADWEFFQSDSAINQLLRVKHRSSEIDDLLIKWQDHLGHYPLGRLMLQKDFESTSAFQTTMVSTIMLLSAAILMLIITVVIVFSVSSDIVNEYKTIGVMKAMGYHSRSIPLIYLIQYTMLTILGLAVGLVGAYYLSRMLMEQFFLKSLGLAGRGLDIGLSFSGVGLFILALVWLVILFSAAKSIRIRPIEAIRHKLGAKESQSKAMTGLLNRLRTEPMLTVQGLNRKKGQMVFLALIAALVLFIMVLVINATKPLQDQAVFRQYSGLGMEDVSLETSAQQEEFDRLLAEIEADGDIADYSVISEAMTVFIAEQSGKAPSDLITYILGRGSAGKLMLAEGKDPADQSEVAISTALAKQYDKQVGDDIVVELFGQSKSLKITGIFSSTMNFGKNIRLSQSLIDDLIDFVPNRIQLYAGAEVADSVLVKRYQDHPGVTSAKSMNQEVKDFTDKILGGVEIAILTVNALMWAILLIILFNVINLSVLKDKKSIGIMRSIGLKNGPIWRVTIIPIAIASLIGLGLGVALFGWFGHGLINDMYQLVGITRLPSVSGLTDYLRITGLYLLFIVLGSIPPLWSILKTPLFQIIKEEE